MNGITIRRSVLDGLTLTILIFVFLSLMIDPTTEQLLNLAPIAFVFVSCMVLGILFSYLLNLKGIKTWGQKLFAPQFEKASPWFKTFWGWQFFVTLMVLIIVGIVKTRFSIVELFDEDGFAGAKRLFVGIFNPN